jgi:parvulin-like peptidyl-prolyl isomerase
MKRDSILALFLALAAAIPAAAIAQAPTTPSGSQNPAVLEVNGEIVYAAEISMTMQNVAARMGGREKVEDENALMQMATQRVVEQKLLAQEARRTNVQANELRLAEMVQAIERQAGGLPALESSIGAFGMSYDQLVAYLREMELSRALIEKQISPTIQVTDDEVKAFYEENGQLFDVEEQVRARQIMFPVTLSADTATVAAARAKADQARQRALRGEDFAQLAKDVSEGPAAANGGEMPPFTRQQTTPQFANAAFALEPGEISPVVRTPYGLHVIKVEEKLPARRLSLDEVSEDVRGLLVQQETGQKVGKLVESLREEATIINLVEDPAAANPPGPPQ